MFQKYKAVSQTSVNLTKILSTMVHKSGQHFMPTVINEVKKRPLTSESLSSTYIIEYIIRQESVTENSLNFQPLRTMTVGSGGFRRKGNLHYPYLL